MAVSDLRTGTRIPDVYRRGLPDPSRPIQLADGRILTRLEVMPDLPDGPPGTVLGGSFWTGPRGLQVIATLDHTDAWGPLLHVSVAYSKLSRMPSWDDIKQVKAAFFGDVDACMILPTADDYVNVRANAFGLWQTPERWGIR